MFLLNGFLLFYLCPNCCFIRFSFERILFLKRMLSGVTSRSSSSPINSIDCSRERSEKVLISLGKEELMNLIKEKKDLGESPDIEMSCHFCDKKYNFTEEDIVDIAHTYSKDIEHLEENIESLAEIFETNEVFSVEKMIITLIN